MSPEFTEWLKLIFRWMHVFAGIMWVGTTYFFTWLDGRFVELEKSAQLPNPNSKPQPGSPDHPQTPAPNEKHVWMVHSGGFYVVEKQRVPQVMPEKLHWFRWEAAITWLSGLLLFLLVYFHGRLLVNLEDAPMAFGPAMALSLGLLLAAWPVYDLLWFRLVRNPAVGVVLSFALIAALSWFLCRYLAWRAAYMQLGSMLGTIMAANVWFRILPAQNRMVAALKAGLVPDQTAALNAKSCSKHNTFLAVPVVFIMISNHFPTITFGNPYNWQILSGLVLLGWGAAKVIRRA